MWYNLNKNGVSNSTYRILGIDSQQRRMELTTSCKLYGYRFPMKKKAGEQSAFFLRMTKMIYVFLDKWKKLTYT